MSVLEMCANRCTFKGIMPHLHDLAYNFKLVKQMKIILMYKKSMRKVSL